MATSKFDELINEANGILAENPKFNGKVLPKYKLQAVVRELFRLIAEKSKTETVQIPDFGTFTHRKRKARVVHGGLLKSLGRGPVEVAEHNVPIVKFSKVVKSQFRYNSGESTETKQDIPVYSVAATL